MQSFGNLLLEAQEKILDVKEALCHCEQEQVNLGVNLNVTKQHIKESVERHSETLASRAKWLVCHAESIFHLKKNGLSQRLAQLHDVYESLDSSLNSADSNIVDLRNKVGIALKTADSVLMSPLAETGSMRFTANNDQLENMIIQFGDVDVHIANEEVSSSKEFEWLSEDGICVIKPGRKDSIELQVKSIEMHHLTCESANQEKDVSRAGDSDVIPAKDEMSHEVSEGMKDWLIQKGCGSKAKSPATSVNNLNGKVTNWLRTCDSFSLPGTPGENLSVDFDVASNDISAWICEDKTKGLTSKAAIPTQHISTDMENFNKILNTKHTEYLKGSCIPSVASCVSVSKSNLSHMDSILRADLNKYLANSQKKQLHRSQCDWLAGEKKASCKDCRGTCPFDDVSTKWVKTATEW